MTSFEALKNHIISHHHPHPSATQQGGDRTTKSTPKKSPTPTTSPDTSLSGPSFYIRQYAGLVLCLVAIAGTVLVSLSELEGPYSVAGIMFFLCVAAVALLLHEMRPYVGPGWQEVSDYQQAQVGKQE